MAAATCHEPGAEGLLGRRHRWRADARTSRRWPPSGAPLGGAWVELDLGCGRNPGPEVVRPGAADGQEGHWLPADRSSLSYDVGIPEDGSPHAGGPVRFPRRRDEGARHAGADRPVRRHPGADPQDPVPRTQSTALAIWAIPALLSAQSWVDARQSCSSRTIALDFLILTKRYIPAKYVIIGTILLFSSRSSRSATPSRSPSRTTRPATSAPRRRRSSPSSATA